MQIFHKSKNSEFPLRFNYVIFFLEILTPGKSHPPIMRRKKVNNFQGKKAIECATQNRDLYSNFVFFSLAFAMSLCYSIALVPHGFALLLFSVSFGIFLCLSFLIRLKLFVVVVSHCCNLIEWMHAEKKTQHKTEGKLLNR